MWWSWGESNPRPTVRERMRYDHSRFEPNAGSLAGQMAIGLLRQPTPGLSQMSAVFLAVSVLSRCHPSLLLPGCDGLAPCGIAAHDDSPLRDQITRIRSGGESELLIGNSFVAPFSESEQLGSQTRPTVLMSKPVSPLKRYVADHCTTRLRKRVRGFHQHVSKCPETLRRFQE